MRMKREMRGAGYLENSVSSATLIDCGRGLALQPLLHCLLLRLRGVNSDALRY
jgi:hypothetical protein